MTFHREPLGQKHPALVSPRIRKSARGRNCSLRLPCCNYRPETTVLAHIRMLGNAGIGMKPDDWFAVYACSSCHDAIDRRGGDTSGLWGFEALLRALYETQKQLWADGLVGELK